MQTINLLPLAARHELRSVLLRRRLTLFGLGCTAVLLLAAAGLALMNMALTERLAAANVSLQRLFQDPAVATVLATDTAAGRFNKLLTTIDGFGRTPAWANLARLVAADVPPGVNVQHLAFDAATRLVTIQGIAATRADELAFQEALAGNPAFTNVQAPLADIVNDRSISFSITAAIHEP